MKNIRELLHDADPLRHEPHLPAHEYDLRRQALMAAATRVMAPDASWVRPRIAILATVTLAVITMVIVGSQMWSGVIAAPVRFEVRLAEDAPAARLREARILGSDRVVYLHPDVIVTNNDISEARVIEDQGMFGVGVVLVFGVGVEFKSAGAEKMQAATENHLGKPVAILIDGQVVTAPVLRSPIATSAVISGAFTRAEAQRIVDGISIQ